MNPKAVKIGEEEYIKEPNNGLIKHKIEEIEEIRRKNDMGDKEIRDYAISVINDWIQQQEHFMKKDFSKDYIERCLVGNKGSIEKAKTQIDKMCTFRTSTPHHFEVIDIRRSELMKVFDMAEIAMVPQLTENLYRIFIIKYKKDAELKSSDYVLLFRLYSFMAEYLQNYEYCLGFSLIYDLYDANVTDIFTKLSLVELQQSFMVLSQGFGCKFKEIYIITGSKIMNSFFKVIRVILSKKIMNRIRCVPSREKIQEFVKIELLPKEYGGLEKSTQELADLLIQSLTEESVPEMIKELHKAKTDESKRQKRKSSKEITEMPDFRTINLD